MKTAESIGCRSGILRGEGSLGQGPPRRAADGHGKFAWALLLVAALGIGARTRAVPPIEDMRRIEFETDEVTAPEIAVAPDGTHIVFSMLGHLYRLPAGGGTAVQLTHGSSYNTDPSFSPDGRFLAFVSDRDGSDGNLFLLDIAAGAVSQLTREFRVASPAWSPDGRTIAYFYYPRREEYDLEAIPGIGFGPAETKGIRTVPAKGGPPTEIKGPGAFGALFYLADGRLAWTAGGRSRGSGAAEAVFQALSPQGAAHLGTFPGPAGAASARPSGRELYYASGGDLFALSLPEGSRRRIGSLPGGQARPVAAPDGKALYAGGGGKLWRIELDSGNARAVPWRARVAMEIRNQARFRWKPPATQPAPARLILTPRLSPDGSRLVFMAAGALWEQPLSGGDAGRLLADPSFQCDPSFSPDGRRLAFTCDNHGTREVRVFDFETRRCRTLYSVGGSSWPLAASWSPDGRRLVVQQTDGLMGSCRFVGLNFEDGKAEQLGQSGRMWNARPHFSPDGKELYFTGRLEKYAQLYRLPLAQGARPEAVTRLGRHVHDALVSPDGIWVAFRRNTEIWLARMAARPLEDGDFQCLSTEGGLSFAFTPDSSAIVYSSANRVWRHPVPDGKPVEVALRLALPRPVAPPLLVRNARVLQFPKGGFIEAASILIDQGRIRWIGSESGREIPPGTLVLDAQARYAIPGLHDSHVHSVWANQQATEDSFIAYGVTSVRDLGGRLDLARALQDRGDATDLPVPRYFPSGEIFEGLMPMWGDAFLEIATPEEARAYVRRWHALGAECIKVYPSLPWSLQRIVAEEAHRVELPPVGHGLSIDEIVRGITLGFVSLEHTAGPIYDDVIRLMALSGTHWDPTLTVGEKSAIHIQEDPGRFADAKIRTFVPAEALAATLRGPGMFSGRSLEALHAGWKSKLERIRAAHRGGVRLLDGTDALMTGIFFGPSLHWELEYLAEAGLPAAEVLRLATLGAAEAVGAAADLGSLEIGKLADLVLLDADPLADMRNTQRIWRVIKEGRVFDPEKLRPQAPGGSRQP